MNMINKNELTYRFATTEDIDILVSTRMDILIDMLKLDQSTDMSKLASVTRPYYERALTDGTQLAVLVFNGDKFVGAGAVCLYEVMPTFYNISGKRGYIMNMYTCPEYRGQGIATKTVDMLVNKCKELGYTHITLSATDMGQPVYEKYGFKKMDDQMIYKVVD
ncbi:MAG: GNAT family N-acetyltransferase [Lachnospiraceae bacterium]|nr:GNAT family N-acetyltransferase [Lachnospiraceae bacterium]